MNDDENKTSSDIDKFASFATGLSGSLCVLSLAAFGKSNISGFLFVTSFLAAVFTGLYCAKYRPRMAAAGALSGLGGVALLFAVAATQIEPPSRSQMERSAEKLALWTPPAQRGQQRLDQGTLRLQL